MRKLILFLFFVFTICKAQTNGKVFHNFSLFENVILFDGKIANSITANGDTIILRYWGVNTVVDIVSVNDNYMGTIGHYAMRVKHRSHKDEKIYCRKIPLDTGLARKASVLFNKLISDSLETRYGQDSSTFFGVMDGYKYVFNKKSSNVNMTKEFLCPPLFKDRFIQAAIVNSLHTEFYKALNLNISFNQFKSFLPCGKYRVGVYTIYWKKRFFRRKIELVLKKLRYGFNT